MRIQQQKNYRVAEIKKYTEEWGQRRRPGPVQQDLTVMAAEGKLDPVVGRDREITRLIQI